MFDLKKILMVGAALSTASVATAVDLPDPTYTYCELEGLNWTSRVDLMDRGNDGFDYIEIVTAPTEFADCFYITGKLQKDCIWDRQPKCCLIAYSKPLAAFDESGRSIGLVEEVLQVADPFEGMAHLELLPLNDGTVRIGVASVFDCFDGTLNGLFSNGLHGETGEVTIGVNFSDLPPAPRNEVMHDEEYTFNFGEGRWINDGFRGDTDGRPVLLRPPGNDALRLAYVVPEGTNLVEIWCDDSTGTTEVCWDVDFYWVEGLEERELYCITQVGGKDYDCNATDTAIGWFDKNGNQQGGDFGINIGKASSNVAQYSEICVIADDLGSIRFAVSGAADRNFNGLDDWGELMYLEFLEEEGYIEDDNNVVKGENWIPGASTKTNVSDVVRLSREDFDEYPMFAQPPAHGVCGCYTYKVRLNPHTDEGDDDDDFGGGGLAQRADMSGDGFVDAVDLAMLLSFWGPVQ